MWCNVRIRAVLVGFAIIGAILAWASGVQAKPAQEGAFLTEYAGSVDEIIQQVEANRLVALRYAKHFRMDPASVLVYFQNELSLATLDTAGAMKVYLIGDSSKIVVETREFRKGTRVFVDRQGVPLLEFGTGNPLGTSIEPAKPVKDQIEDASKPKSEQNAANNATQVAQAQPQQGPTTPPAPTPQDVSPSPAVIPVDATTPPVTTPTASPTVVASTLPGDTGPINPEISHSRSSNWMIPLGLAGIAIALTGGGGSTSSPPTNGTNNRPPPINVVPEPLSLVMMGSGLAALAGGAWRKRRRK